MTNTFSEVGKGNRLGLPGESAQGEEVKRDALLTPAVGKASRFTSSGRPTRRQTGTAYASKDASDRTLDKGPGICHPEKTAAEKVAETHGVMRHSINRIVFVLVAGAAVASVVASIASASHLDTDAQGMPPACHC
jgi:hypothetical protein